MMGGKWEERGGAPSVLICAFPPAGIYYYCHFHRIATTSAALKGCRITWCDWTGVMECCGRGERSEPNDRLYLRNVATCASLLITDSANR